MVTRAKTTTGLRVHLRRPSARDAEAFLAAVRTSRRLHGAWVSAPATRAEYKRYLARFGRRRKDAQHLGFVAVLDDDALVGVLNFSEIVHGAFKSAYLGYYALAPHAGRGYMTEALLLGLDAGFREIGLHRIEVNVQPGNARSIKLVERLGFVREGYSRRYVKVGGRWRDHVRYAILAEDWPRRRRSVLAGLREERR